LHVKSSKSVEQIRGYSIIVEWVVDAGIEPQDGCFLRGLVKGAKSAWCLGWRQTVIAIRGVRNSLQSEHVGEDRDGVRLGGVAAGIRGEAWSDEKRVPVRIDDALNVGHGAKQTLRILGLPTADECTCDRQANPHIRLGRSHQGEAMVSRHLANDGHPTARRRAGRPGMISQRDGLLLCRQAQAGVIDLQGIRVDRRGGGTGVGRRGRWSDSSAAVNTKGRT
jgi:hypothetical protein